MTNGSDVYAEDGSLLFLGFDNFLSRVVKAGGCFLCGSTHLEGDCRVNKEHIIPLWLIRHAGISSQSVTLANGGTCMYGSYKMPICTSCNSELGKTYEDVISPELKSGYERFRLFFGTSPGYALTYRWLCLVLLKLLLGDNKFARERDERLGLVANIGSSHRWDRHHHLLCVARSGVVGGLIDPVALGSVFLIKAKDRLPFDLATFPIANSIKIQVGDVVLIGFLDDAQFVAAQLADLSRPFPSEMDSMQIVEFMIRMSTLAESLNPRPNLYTEFTTGVPIIRANRPSEVFLPSQEKHAKMVADRLYAHLLRSGLLASLPEPFQKGFAEGRATFFPEVLCGKDWVGFKDG